MKSLSDESIFEIYRKAVDHFPDDSIFVELGCWYGSSVIYLAERIKESGKDITVFAIDTWQNALNEPNVFGSIFPEFWNNVMDHGCEQIIRPMMIDSSSAALAFENNSVDFLYIDAGHRYNEVSKDIIKWMPKVNSWIGGHDYNQEVEQAVKDILIDEYGYEVEGFGQGEMSFLVRDLKK